MADTKGTAAGLVTATYRPTVGNRVKLYTLGSDDPTGASGSFADLAAAIKGAQHFIFIADWSFQALTRIEPRVGPPSVNQTVGKLLSDAAKDPKVLVAIHVWDHTAIGAPDDRNDEGDIDLDTIAAFTNKPAVKRSPNLLWRKSSRAGVGNSIHQKFVVLDADDGTGSKRVVKAFLGGLDLTKGRFDFAAHPIVPPTSSVTDVFAQTVNVPGTPSGGLKGLSGDEWYNAEFSDDRTMPREPWQDFYLQMIGPSAWDVLREFVGRWNTTGSSNVVATPTGNITPNDRLAVQKKFLAAFQAPFLQPNEPHTAPPDYSHNGGPFQARIVRSLDRDDWGECTIPVVGGSLIIATETPVGTSGKTQREFTWKLGADLFESSIQNTYIRAIDTADRFIYIENQYFIGSGARWTNGIDRKGKPRAAAQSGVKNDVPGAIVRKIVDRIAHDLPFHAYIVTPMFPEGKPNEGAGPRQRFFEFQTMKFMAIEVARAAEAKGKDWKDFLSFYCLANWSAVGATQVLLSGTRRARVQGNGRYQIYVHSKLMIIDDEFLIVGSANLNERSQAGDRDTEIAVWLTASEDSPAAARQIINELRQRTWGQHLGGPLPPNFDSPETTICSGQMRSLGEINWVAMQTGAPSSNGQLLHFPFEVDTKNATMQVRTLSPSSPRPFDQQDPFIFDAPMTKKGHPLNENLILPDASWLWSSPGPYPKKVMDFLAE